VNTNMDRQTYKVVMVEKIATPKGMPGNNWHRYVIRRDKSVVEGMRPGTLDSVTQHAESAVENLNLRSGCVSAVRKQT
jgi:hypothetical protein